MRRNKILAMLTVICMIFSIMVVAPVSADDENTEVVLTEDDAVVDILGVPATFDGDKPVATYDNLYEQSFSDTWDGTKFYGQWVFVGDQADRFAAADVVNGGIKFAWVKKRIIGSYNIYTLPYIFEVDMARYDVGGNNGGGAVIRAKEINDDLQECIASDATTFNQEGIAFYSSKDGTKLNIQFSGVKNGSSTVIQSIPIAAPAGVNFFNRGILRIEDFGTTIYTYYNNAPIARIDLGGKVGTIYTSGTVYNANMTVAGTFTNKEVEVFGRIAIAQRDSGIYLYKATVKWATDFRAAKRETLLSSITNAGLLSPANYTSESWAEANLPGVISAAQATYNNSDATLAQLDDAIASIAAAILLLEIDPRVAIRVTLASSIANAGLLSSANYTPESWAEANLPGVIIAAQATYNNVNATVAQLNDAIASIDAAILLLEGTDHGYLALNQPFAGQSITEIQKNWSVHGGNAIPPTDTTVAPITNDGIMIGPAGLWTVRFGMKALAAYENYEMTAIMKATEGDKATFNLRQVPESDVWEGDTGAPERTGFIGAVINFNSGVTNKIDLTIRNGSCQINQGGSRLFIPDIALPAGANVKTGIAVKVKDTGDKIELYVNNTLLLTINLDPSSIKTGDVQVGGSPKDNNVQKKAMTYYSSGNVVIASTGARTNFTNSAIPVCDKESKSGIISFGNRVGTLFVKDLKIFEARVIPAANIEAISVTNQQALSSIKNGTSVAPVIKYKLEGIDKYIDLTNQQYRLEIADRTIIKLDLETGKLVAKAAGKTSFRVVMTGPGGVEVKSAPIFIRVEQTANPRKDIELIVRQINALIADATTTPEQMLCATQALAASYGLTIFENSIENAVAFFSIMKEENLDPATATEAELVHAIALANSLIAITDAISSEGSGNALREALFGETRGAEAFGIETPIYNKLSNSGQATVMRRLYDQLFAIVDGGGTILISDIKQLEVIAAEVALTDKKNEDTDPDPKKGTGSRPAYGVSIVTPPVIPEGPVVTFNDLNGVEWAKTAIEALVKKKILLGYGNGEFKPNNTITRDEFAKVLVLAFNIPTEGVTANFSDIPSGSWQYPYVAAGSAAGIIKGIDVAQFGSGKNITREDMAVMITRAIAYKGKTLASAGNSVVFNDNDKISAYADDAVNTLVAANILSGMNGGMFAPKENATRAQAAKVVYGVLTSLGL